MVLGDSSLSPSLDSGARPIQRNWEDIIRPCQINLLLLGRPRWKGRAGR